MLYVRVFFLLFFNCVLLHAHERITSFISNITVHSNATLSVEENIEVISEHKAIKHGIVREFPTKYSDIGGTHYKVDFNIQSIKHNGHATEYTIESVSNGKKIYIGDKNIVVPRGKNLYTIQYTTNRQLGFFHDHDEIYWNVTGTGWRLPIDKAQARVQLPQNISPQSIHAQAYTGYQGEEGKNYTYSIQDNCINFSTIHGLKQYEGITIVATFPKGFVIEPSWYQKIYWFFHDNFLILLLCILFFLLAIVLIMGIITARRINMQKNVIPLFHPPVDMMPCDVGFMKKMQFENFLLTADIVNLAVRGFITITYRPNILYGGTYTLTIKDSIASLANHKDISKYDIEILSALFSTKESLVISQAHSAEIIAAVAECKKHTSTNNSSYITTLTHFLYPSMLLFLLLVSTVLLFLLDAKTIDDIAINIFVISIIVMPIIFFFFKKLFRVYTPAGRNKQDAIDGFTLYLTTAEIERMHIIGTPPTRTPELYEKYLPYAIALGIEKQWTAQFSAVFKNFEKEGRAYHPFWYRGRMFNANNFKSNFTNSFATTIASASIRPGSSSGVGGKGRSGGGGGGGGGGGW